MARSNSFRRFGSARSVWGRGTAVALVVAMGALAPLAGAGAQGVRPDTRQGNSTRAELEAALREAEQRGTSDARQRAAAEAIRTRLRNGDFAAGDRIVVEVRGDSALFDTLTVRVGPVVRLAGLPDVPLQGVLRSELQDHLTKFLSRYIRQPDVRAESLIRLSMLGQVGKPGFYDFNSDMLLTDAIMAAGGPTGDAALDRSTIRRGRDVVLAKESVRRAAQSGATLDRLGLRPGDEITVGEKRTRNWQTIAGTIGVISSVVVALSFLFR